MTRIGLVLGAGGLPAEAFHRGVLQGLLEGAGWDARSADLVVGTSAGSLVAAALRAPGSPPRGVNAAPAPVDALPRLPRLPGLGALAAAARAPRTARLSVLATSLVPSGSHDTDVISDGVRQRYGDSWPTSPAWVVAVRARDGKRAVLGRGDADEPECTFADAVAASCAIPGYFRPVLLDGVPHVDGGVHSPTNADVVSSAGLDVVIVSSPMSASPTALRRPRVDASVRLFFHRYLARELRLLRRAGTRVLVVEPDVEALRHWSWNALDTAHVEDLEQAALAQTTRALRSRSAEPVLSALRPRMSA